MSNVELFLFKEGQGIESLGVVFPSKPIAKWHLENTFGDVNGKVLINNSNKRVNNAISEIVNTTDKVLVVKASLDKLSISPNAVKYSVEQTTLLKLYLDEVIKNTRNLGKIVKLEPTENDFHVQLVTLNNQPINFVKLHSTLENMVLSSYIDVADDVEETVEVQEEVTVEEVVEEEVSVEETVEEVEEEEVSVEEEVVAEETVEEVEEEEVTVDEVDEIVEEEIVEEEVVESDEEIFVEADEDLDLDDEEELTYDTTLADDEFDEFDEIEEFPTDLDDEI